MKNFVSLNTKCPHCHESLMDEKHPHHGQPTIKLNIEFNNERGVLRLCSLFGCYDHTSDLELKDGDVVDVYCPHCNQELSSDIICDDENCSANLVPLQFENGVRVLFCSRKGCSKHYVSFESLSDEISNMYSEFYE